MLSPEDLDLLEASLLPALERHYLRLLAHGLRTLQTMASTSADPLEIPDRARMEQWAAHQGAMAGDPAFQETFLEQLCRLVEPLEEIAARSGQPALSLQIPQLVAWAQEQADARLSHPDPPPG